MLTFKGGPADGKTLMLKRAPRFLRVTQRRFALGQEESEELDGLDQPGDVPKDDETLHAYEVTQPIGQCHMRFGGKQKAASGFYPIATYVYIDMQPTDAQMRDQKLWEQWCSDFVSMIIT